jgi:hypothetical protein
MLTFAGAGLLIAGYLILVQLDVLANAWDPLFGTPSTKRVLDLTHPVPDAAAGVIAYATEVALLFTRRGQLVLGVVLGPAPSPASRSSSSSQRSSARGARRAWPPRRSPSPCSSSATAR